jgi:tyrosyl-tRNA synthetase
MVKVDPQKIEELLSRSIAEILPSKEDLRQLLLGGKKIRVYVGADATGPQLHIGHSTNFIILEKLRQMGHEVFVLFGDFTAMIGDPTDKMAERRRLTKKQVEENIKTWKRQLSKTLDFNDKKNPAKIVKNSKWLSELKLSDLIDIASHFTVQRMLERDMFERRLKEEKPIYLHEFMYPLMQGYDSVALNVDLEIGGTDQTFNMLAGRMLQKVYDNRDKFVLTTTLLVNPLTGKKLMSKSEGGFIALNDKPNEMFGKVMALPDEVIVQIFIDCTHLPMETIRQMEKEIKNGANPKDYKMRLAFEIVKLYHGEKAAKEARDNFVRVFQKKEAPEEIPVKKVKSEQLFEILVEAGLAESKSEARRLIEQGGVKVDDKIIKDIYFKPDLEKQGVLIQKGKRFFVKVKRG